MKAYFSKIHGELKWFWLKDYLNNCKDWSYEINIKKIHNSRSLEQNSLYWSWLSELQEKSDIWYTADEWAEVFKEHFLKVTVKCRHDKRKKIKKYWSTTDLDTVWFNIYLDKIKLFADTHCNVKLEYPNEFNF